MVEHLKVPTDRVGALIGSGGETKRLIQEKAGVNLDITHDGDITIASPEEDGFKEWRVMDVVKAIGRGFNPKYALNLLKEDYTLSIFDLYDTLGGRERDIKRVKARIIGEGGKAREIIERLTKCKISVYGKTVSVIGGEEDMDIAEKALNMLIDGARHATVYKFLESAQKERKTGL